MQFIFIFKNEVTRWTLKSLPGYESDHFSSEKNVKAFTKIKCSNYIFFNRGGDSGALNMHLIEASSVLTNIFSTLIQGPTSRAEIRKPELKIKFLKMALDSLLAAQEVDISGKTKWIELTSLLIEVNLKSQIWIKIVNLQILQ